MQTQGAGRCCNNNSYPKYNEAVQGGVLSVVRSATCRGRSNWSKTAQLLQREMSKATKKRRPKNDQKKESAAIDVFLSERELERKPVAKDGSCLFRAVAEQVRRPLLIRKFRLL